MTTALDAWGEQLQRQLSAGPRRFSSVQAVLGWFVAARSRRLGRSIDLTAIGTPQSQAHLDQAQVTYAAVLPCLTTRHPADLPEEPLAYARDAEQARREAERRITELTCWYSRENGNVRVADELGMSPEACDRYCRAIARVLRRRMERAGLIEERGAQAHAG